LVIYNIDSLESLLWGGIQHLQKQPRKWLQYISFRLLSMFTRLKTPWIKNKTQINHTLGFIG